MSIIIRPIITEKTSQITEDLGRYTFLVNPKANKIEIKKAVEEAYEITVTKVRTMRYAPKSKSRYTKGGFLTGKTNLTKKAIIEVVEGDVIDIYANS